MFWIGFRLRVVDYPLTGPLCADTEAWGEMYLPTMVCLFGIYGPDVFPNRLAGIVDKTLISVDEKSLQIIFPGSWLRFLQMPG